MRENNLIKTACGGRLEVAGMQRLQSADPGINQKIGEITGYISAEQKKRGKLLRKSALGNGNLK